MSAYASVHGEIDTLITQAKVRAEKDAALFAGQSTAITAPDAQHPLSVREIAGIAGQVLLDIHAAAWISSNTCPAIPAISRTDSGC